jgi:tetratricopeptide (TPR) repeat protein
VNRVPHTTAIVLRSLALFAVLYQFRLIAGVLADTAVFTAVVCGAFAAACLLAAMRVNEKKPAPLAALAAIACIPWMLRVFIAMPRLFFPASADALAVTLDSLLLNIDRNNFVSLLPFYWAAGTTWFSIRSRVFLRGAIVADAVLLLVLFSMARTAGITLYRWPVVMIGVFAGVVFIQALAMLFSLPVEVRLRTGEKIAAIAALLAIVVIGGMLFLRPLQERAVEKGGGLLEPKLFSFDFSQFLRLDSEISMNDDLVLIVKKDNDDDHILLRRSVLSGYSKKQGFYRIEELDERTHPQRLPERPVRFTPAAFKSSRTVTQEYFLVNFDAAAFVGMKEPVSVTPYESWDASSFKSAYSVESLTSTAALSVLSASGWPTAADLGLSEDEFKIYTEYGNDARIGEYARRITGSLDRYGDKVRMVHNWLKYGEYRYSLKPGIAPDGDQLAWFLFESKKGYCSYYAFAMTLMLRSQGIPARVAAGFFLDPASNTFNYYPVRSDMAHAWVEVPFPGYGWIEFDPTTDNLAEDEEFRFSPGVDPNLFERLMREILENRSRLKIKQGEGADASLAENRSPIEAAARLFKQFAPPLLPFLVALLFLYIRCGYFVAYLVRRDRRKRASRLWSHCQRRLALAGFGRTGGLAEAEWAAHCDASIAGIYALYQNAAAGRFAPHYSESDLAALWNKYLEFRAAYRIRVSLWRRLLAWIAPPLALVLGREKRGGLAVILLLPLFTLFSGSNAAAQQSEAISFSAADELYSNATEAEFAEFWERAIELYKEGNKKYPDDLRFPLSLGNLYYSRSLYTLAWDEYRKAERIDPFNTGILLRLAHTAGYLNRDAASVEYLERLLAINPNHTEAIGNLGWMYYKVHRPGEGERILLSALERFGDDPDLAMTLGTVYSDMYRYTEGKYWYQKAIAMGQAMGDRTFTAVAHYNLSILESRFYHFALSMDEANASLESQNRASGHLARGEIYMRRLDLKQSQTDYESAYEIDTSPLAKLNLAQIYQISGRLEEARLYAEDCLAASDLSWMMNYGIDPDRYKRDIHDILYKTYAGLARTEQFMPWGRTGEKINSLFRLISYRFKSAVHRILYRKYSLAAADAYGGKTGSAEEPNLDSFIQYYNAFEDYPRRAITYLRSARDFETALIPAAGPSYHLEEGLLMKNERLVTRAAPGFDSEWEREMISQCYRYFAKNGAFGRSAPQRNAMRQSAAGELFAINRGALRQAGIGLAAEISVNGGQALSTRGEKTLRAVLKKAGIVHADSGARFKLTITINGAAASGYTAYCELVDSAGIVTRLRRSFPVSSFSRAGLSDFARAFGAFVFQVGNGE